MFHFIFNFLNYITSRIMNLFTWTRSIKDMKDLIHINIKSGNDKSVSIDVEPKWTIKQVKEKVGPKINLKPGEIRVIFAGQELDDSIVIEDCDLGDQSIVHVVRAISSSDHSSHANQTLISNVLKDKLTENDLRTTSCLSGKRKVHFYVYCSTCKDVFHGKLRVRCGKCKQGTLTVTQDPTCWEDVLKPGQIQGSCQAENCDGTIAEFYFKCFNHSSLDNDCVVLNMIRPNLNEIPCLACMEISSPVLLFECAERHNLCLSCFQEYCLSRLNERMFIQHPELGYTLQCPENCENSIIKETHHFRVLGNDQYVRYQQFATEECVLQAGGVLCPQAGCGAGILPDPECRRIACVKQGEHGCGYVFCRNCLQGYHIGDCIDGESSQCSRSEGDSSAFHTEKSKWDDASKLMIKINTKPCPKCRTATERDGGCMHMVCGRPQCGFHWCWLCQEEWTRDCMGNHWFG